MCIHGSHDEKNDEMVGQDHRHQADEAASAIAATAARGSETRQKAAKLQSFLLVAAEQIGALRERAAAGTAAATAGTTTHSYPAIPPQQNMALAKDGRAVQALDDLARLLSPDNLPSWCLTYVSAYAIAAPPPAPHWLIAIICC